MAIHQLSGDVFSTSDFEEHALFEQTYDTCTQHILVVYQPNKHFSHVIGFNKVIMHLLHTPIHQFHLSIMVKMGDLHHCHSEPLSFQDALCKSSALPGAVTLFLWMEPDFQMLKAWSIGLVLLYVYRVGQSTNLDMQPLFLFPDTLSLLFYLFKELLHGLLILEKKAFFSTGHTPSPCHSFKVNWLIDPTGNCACHKDIKNLVRQSQCISQNGGQYKKRMEPLLGYLIPWQWWLSG